MTILTQLNLRQFDPAHDYPALSAIWNACYPQHPMGVRDLQVDDEGFYIDGEQTQFKRWVVEVEGQVVGAGQRFRPMIDYHPQRFRVEVFVLPEFQQQGIGTQLYQ